MSAIVLEVGYSVGGGPVEPTPARFIAALERAGAEAADVGKHILPRVAAVLEGATAKQFGAQGSGPIAGSWAKLSESYASWKSQRFPGAPTLVATGKLKAALTDATAQGARRDISGNSMAFGTAGVPYAAFHQTGTAKMPARPPFDFGGDFEEELTRAMSDGVRAAVREGSQGALAIDGGGK